MCLSFLCALCCSFFPSQGEIQREREREKESERENKNKHKNNHGWTTARQEAQHPQHLAIVSPLYVADTWKLEKLRHRRAVAVLTCNIPGF